MRVIFNGLSAFRARTGVGSYVANLLAEFPGVAGDLEIAAFPSGWMAGVAHFAGRMAPSAHHLAPKSAWRPPRFRWRGFLNQFGQSLCRRGFQMICASGDFDLYHEPNFVPWPVPVPTVLTVHDLSVLLHPEWHPADRVRHHEKHFYRAVRDSRHIIAVSQTVRTELIEQLGLPPTRVTAVHNGVRADMAPMPQTEVREVLRRLGLPQSFVLYVGAIEPRKNLVTLMRAYCGLPADLRERFPLVLAGPWGWNYQEERAYYDSIGRGRGVIHVGYVADDVLPALYNAARVLAYPSHYEGFGLPPVEMLACGGAVMASTAPALCEVLHECAEFIAPLDEAGWRAALHQALTDDEYIADLRRGGIEHARRYSWRAAAASTCRIYRDAVGRSALRAA